MRNDLRQRIALATIALALGLAALAAGWAAGAERCASQACEQRVKAEARAACKSVACKRRVDRRQVRAAWRRAVLAYGVGTLRARAACEGSSNYGLRLANGFWFVHQFELRAWVGAGGKVRGGQPVGAWSYHPTRLELDYRAVVWDRIHGGDPWPNCP